MPYELKQWPSSIQNEVEELPTEAKASVLVMLRGMSQRGPWLPEYKIKPLPRHLHGLNQVNLRNKKEQIRVLFFVSGNMVVIVRVFKKTSPQEEQQAYKLAAARMRTAKAILESGNGLPTIN